MTNDQKALVTSLFQRCYKPFFKPRRPRQTKRQNDPNIQTSGVPRRPDWLDKIRKEKKKQLVGLILAAVRKTGSVSSSLQNKFAKRFNLKKNLIEELVLWMFDSKKLDTSHEMCVANMFAKLLANLSADSNTRAILLSFNFSDNFVAEYNHGNREDLSCVEGLDMVLNTIESNLKGIWRIKVAPVYRKLLDFPKDEQEEDESTSQSTSSCSDYSEETTTDAFVHIKSNDMPAKFASRLESRWFRQQARISNTEGQRVKRVLTGIKFLECFRNSTFVVHQELQRSIFSGSLSETLDRIPREIAREAFSVGACFRNNEDPRNNSIIVAALVHEQAQSDVNTISLCTTVRDSMILNDVFFRLFLRAALSPREENEKGNTNVVKLFMDLVFFPNGTDYNMVMLKRVPNVAVILFEEIVVAIEQNKINASHDSVCLLIEYALRFDCIADNEIEVITLMEWRNGGPANGERNVNFVKYIRNNKDFSTWLANIAAPNAPLAKSSNMANFMHTRSPLTESLSDLEGEYTKRNYQHVRAVLYSYIMNSLESFCATPQNERIVSIQHAGETKTNGNAKLDTETRKSLYEFLGQSCMSKFFDFYWEHDLKFTVFAGLQQCGVGLNYKDYVMKRTILSEPKDFIGDVLDAIRVQKGIYLTEEQRRNLTLAAVKLEEEPRDLVERLDRIEHCTGDKVERISQLDHINRQILLREVTQVRGTITVENLIELAILAARAKQVVAANAIGKRRLQNAIQHYLSNKSPNLWCDMFKGLETIAVSIFILYIHFVVFMQRKTQTLQTTKTNRLCFVFFFVILFTYI